MMETIEYHPGGRQPRRVLCFSPHPDDDVISMGGTLIRLVEDRHDVHVAYMTSGNIAVFDHDARRVADLVAEINRRFEIDVKKSPGLETAVVRSLEAKVSGDRRPARRAAHQSSDPLERGQERRLASAACKEENLHFLDLPFYQTGTIDKRPITDDDVRTRPRVARRSRVPIRSTWPATCPTRTARTGSVPRRCSGRSPGSRPRRAARRKCSSIAGRGRNGRSTKSTSPSP